MKESEIIERLSKNLSPVEPLWPMGQRLLFGSFIIISISLFVFMRFWGVRDDLHEQLNNIWFLVQMGLCASLIVIGVLCSFKFSIPRVKPPAAWIFGMILLHMGLLICLLGFLKTDPHEHINFQRFWNYFYMPCIRAVALFSLVAVIIYGFLIRRSLTTYPLATGFFLFSAAAAFGVFAVSLYCGSCDPIHILTSHFIPMILFSGLGLIFGKIFLRW